MMARSGQTPTPIEAMKTRRAPSVEDGRRETSVRKRKCDRGEVRHVPYGCGAADHARVDCCTIYSSQCNKSSPKGLLLSEGGHCYRRAHRLRFRLIRRISGTTCPISLIPGPYQTLRIVMRVPLWSMHQKSGCARQTRIFTMLSICTCGIPVSGGKIDANANVTKCQKGGCETVSLPSQFLGMTWIA